jgi:hypothetical protein
VIREAQDYTTKIMNKRCTRQTPDNTRQSLL